jgi:hypothetical protein
MRATEFTFAPGAYLGAHHHIGRRSIRLATIILKRATSHIPPRTRQTSRRKPARRPATWVWSL